MGLGDTTDYTMPCFVNSLKAKEITRICCSDGFTTAVSSKGELFFWGLSNGQFDFGGAKKKLLTPTLVEHLCAQGVFVEDVICVSEMNKKLSAIIPVAEDGQAAVFGKLSSDAQTVKQLLDIVLNPDLPFQPKLNGSSFVNGQVALIGGMKKSLSVSSNGKLKPRSSTSLILPLTSASSPSSPTNLSSNTLSLHTSTPLSSLLQNGKSGEEGGTNAETPFKKINLGEVVVRLKSSSTRHRSKSFTEMDNFLSSQASVPKRETRGISKICREGFLLTDSGLVFHNRTQLQFPFKVVDLHANRCAILLSESGEVFTSNRDGKKFHPVLFDSPSKAIKVTCGVRHYVVLTEDGIVYFWKTDETSPKPLFFAEEGHETEAKIVEISSGDFHCVALDENGGGKKRT